jgi:hypothetical protein
MAYSECLPTHLIPLDERPVSPRCHREGINPVELAAVEGDVLFLDFLCGHIGSPNRTGGVPRLMMQSRFGIPATLDGHKVGGNVW